MASLNLTGAQVGDDFNLKELYNKSKAQDEFFIKPPNCDVGGSDIELTHLRARKERHIMQKEQKDLVERNAFNARINTNRSHWAKATMKSLREQFIQVNNFSKDCAQKMHLAQSSIAGESAVHETLQKAITEAKQDVEELWSFRNIFAEHVKEYAWCREFMEKIVADSDFYESEEDCMKRCDALSLAKLELKKTTQKKLNEIEEMHMFMVKTAKKAAATALGMSNMLITLARDYRKAVQECQKWEKKLQSALDAASTNDIKIARELYGISYLYTMLCVRSGVRPSHVRDVEFQLDFIKDEVEVMKAVLDELTARGLAVKENQQETTPTC